MSDLTQAHAATCSECGALNVNGLSCWDMLGMLIAWEYNDPELQAEHFLTVACYNLQHPAQLSEAALTGLQAAFIEHLDHGLAVVEIRRRVQDARLCHIVGRPGSAPPVRPPRTAEELLKELQHVFSRSDSRGLDEEAVSVIARQVEDITRRFAEIAGAYKRIELYYHRLRDMGLEETFEQLGAAERESLGLAIFLLEQLDSIGASDYSAPAIHISSVIEIEVQRRVFACPDLVGDLAKPKKQTLGVLPWMRQNPDLTEGNWDRLRAHVAAHWNEQIDPDDPSRTVSFDQFVARALSRIAQLRNMAAHTHPLSRKDYGELQRLAFQGGPLGCGALNALLLAWHV